MKRTHAALLLLGIVALSHCGAYAQLKVGAAVASKSPPPKRSPPSRPSPRTPPAKPPTRLPPAKPAAGASQASKLRPPPPPVEREFLRPPVPPYGAQIPPGRLVASPPGATPPGIVRKAVPRCDVGSFLWPDNMCRTQRPPVNYFASAVQGTISTLTIFNTVANFYFTAGSLASMNATHVVVRTAHGKTIAGSLGIGAVVAPDVKLGSKVDMVTLANNAVTRVKLSDTTIMPVEIRKSFISEFTVLLNPECTSNCQTKQITYESGTMAYIMGSSLTFCRDDMAAKTYALTDSTSFGDVIYPLTRDSLSRGLAIQVLTDTRTGMRVRTDATDFSPKLALSAIKITGGTCAINAPSSSYATTRI